MHTDVSRDYLQGQRGPRVYQFTDLLDAPTEHTQYTIQYKYLYPW